VVLRRVYTETVCNWMAEGRENINGEEELSAGGNILGDIGKCVEIGKIYVHFG
jgi:hypothetical protein